MNKPVILITGGLTGIGRAAAVAFAKKGAKVVVAARRDEAGKALVKELRSFGSEVGLGVVATPAIVTFLIRNRTSDAAYPFFFTVGTVLQDIEAIKKLKTEY